MDFGISKIFGVLTEPGVLILYFFDSQHKLYQYTHTHTHTHTQTISQKCMQVHLLLKILAKSYKLSGNIRPEFDSITGSRLIL